MRIYETEISLEFTAASKRIIKFCQYTIAFSKFMGTRVQNNYTPLFCDI